MSAKVFQLQKRGAPHTNVRDRVDVCIVGGGIVGLYCAAELMNAGYLVRLIDRAYHGPQRDNIGEISMHSHPITLQQFLPYCDQQWLYSSLELDCDLGIMPKGSIRLGTTPDELELIKLQSELVSISGFRGYVLEDTSVLGNILNVQLGKTIHGGVVISSDLAINSTRALTELRRYLIQHGARIWGGDEVRQFKVDYTQGVPHMKGVITNTGDVCEADMVVIAAGIHAVQMLRPLGVDIPLRPARMHMLELTPTDTLPEATMIQPRQLGTIRARVMGEGRVLATYDGILDPQQATFSRDVDPLTARWLRFSLGNWYPALHNAKVNELRTMTLAVTPDLTPCIGLDSRMSGLFLAVGMNGHSFTYASGVSGLLQCALQGVDPGFATYPLAPDRFALDTWTPLPFRQLAKAIGLFNTPATPAEGREILDTPLDPNDLSNPELLTDVERLAQEEAAQKATKTKKTPEELELESIQKLMAEEAEVAAAAELQDMLGHNSLNKGTPSHTDDEDEDALSDADTDIDEPIAPAPTPKPEPEPEPKITVEPEPRLDSIVAANKHVADELIAELEREAAAEQQRATDSLLTETTVTHQNVGDAATATEHRPTVQDTEQKITSSRGEIKLRDSSRKVTTGKLPS